MVPLTGTRAERFPTPAVSLPTRRFGFGLREFFGDADLPFAFRDWHGMHVFSKEGKTLTPEAVQELFASALALPADA